MLHSTIVWVKYLQLLNAVVRIVKPETVTK